MMGGLAYMTGPEGRPLRAGASVNDIMGGMFGAIGVMAALRARDQTGKGQEVLSALYENNVFLMASHMMQFAMSGKPASPMPSRISAWGIYDVFTVAHDEQIFLAVVSDTQWAIFCKRFDFLDLAQDARLATNNLRVTAREWLMPSLRERFSGWSAVELGSAFEIAGLPYSPIRAPHELFDDPHLQSTGGLAEMDLPDGRHVSTPLLPLMLNGSRLPMRHGPPTLGCDTDSVLAAIGFDSSEIAQAHADGVVR
jgi:crotonobetainyl-CoA:carnitine CoA-transferase CaiB-like acyl-CoA transferase